MNPDKPQVAPGLNQHREAILAEKMADFESYDQNGSAKAKHSDEAPAEGTNWTDFGLKN
jgi:CoA:oxalate CoA-transferase